MEKHGLRYTFSGCQIPVTKSLHHLSTKKKIRKEKRKKKKGKQAATGRPEKQRLPIFTIISILSQQVSCLGDDVLQALQETLHGIH